MTKQAVCQQKMAENRCSWCAQAGRICRADRGGGGRPLSVCPGLPGRYHSGHPPNAPASAMVRIVITLDPEGRAWFDRKARETGRPMTALVRKAMAHYRAEDGRRGENDLAELVRKIKDLWLAMVALLFATTSCAGLRPEPTNNQLVEEFLKTLTVRESWIYANYTHPVGKWTGPIRWAMIGNPPDHLRTYLHDTLEEYARLVPLEIRQAQQGEIANYLITFVPDANPASALRYMRGEIDRMRSRGVFLHNHITDRIGSSSYYESVKLRYDFRTDNPLYRQTLCMFSISLHQNSSGIATGHILIDEKFPDLKRCISEETIQALGLRHDTVKPWSSIMSVTPLQYRADNRISASAYDLLYLRALYDSRLKVGMTRDEARPVAIEIFTELRPDETKPPDIQRLQASIH